jgi:hypothetical protein
MSTEINTPTPQTSGDSSSAFRKHVGDYINGWVAAAVILPTAITLKEMPMYECQRSLLLTWTSLSCALILAFLYAGREFIPKAKSKVGRVVSILIPAVFIIATAYCGIKYYETLKGTAQYLIDSTGMGEAMQHLTIDRVPDGEALIVYYILTMVFAECAFFFMAFQEWHPKGTRDQAS